MTTGIGSSHCVLWAVTWASVRGGVNPRVERDGDEGNSDYGQYGLRIVVN
jgi:hypothetical protein